MIKEINRYQSAKGSGAIEQYYHGSIEKAREEAEMRQLEWVEKLEEKLKTFIGENKTSEEPLHIKLIPLK